MKIFLLICWHLVATLAEPNELHEYLHLDKCVGKENATEDDVENFLHFKPATSQEGKCLETCILEQFGVIDRNGRYQPEKLVELASLHLIYAEDVVDIQKTAEECSSIPSGERCEFGAEVIRCLQENIIEDLNLLQECKVKENASNSDIKNFLNSKSPITREGKCFEACLLEDMDIIDEHGQFQPNIIIEMADEDDESKVAASDMATACSLIKNDDRCELAAALNDCLLEGDNFIVL